ncbi:MAG: hypothetical protein A2W00_02150 [Candidatus Eisenbacteria bacterium RBG_16_71_46]|nr:MAG: hypothetical protein A2W00_02150 [Candidatus Eisenbacteria bacterium RBG_16_71_46]
MWATLAVLAVARLALAFVPTMWAWSLNLQRFLEPLPAWAWWTLAAIVLIPALARRAAPAFGWIGDALASGRWGVALGLVAGAAALALAFPDQVRFVGDFLLRQGTVEEADQPGLLFPQALPLDVLLHYTLPLRISQSGALDANGAARALGALEAAGLAALAVGFARALALRGSAAAAAACVVFFGGYLGMFTGYSKAFSEMVVIVAVVGVSGLRVLREGRGLLPLGIAVAAGLALHRSALGLLPALALAWAGWLREHAGGGAWRRPAVLAALAIPLAALAVMLPRIVATVLRFDAQHFDPAEVQAQGGALRAAFAGTRPADLLNLLVMLSPLALAVPVMALALGRGLPRGREALYLGALALPLLGVMPFIHPVGGLFRDWDDFAFSGMALSLLAAWLAGETLRAAPRFAWLGIAAALGAAAPTMQWLIFHADVDRGLARVEAFVSEPPRRTGSERGQAFDFLGIRNFRLERFEASAEALTRAAETSPSPRVLHEWALAETRRGRLVKAQEIYRRLLEKSPDYVMAWLGLGAVSSRIGDVDQARQAAQEILKRQPNSLEAHQLLEVVNTMPQAVVDSLRRVYR